MNYDRITDNMIVGTPPGDQQDVDALVRDGVTHVLNVHTVDDAPLLEGSGLIYCWNPTADWTVEAAFGREPKPVEWFQKSLDFWKLYSVEPSRTLYLHCSAGVNRSATTAWAFLRRLQLRGPDCDAIIDFHRLIATFGTFADHPWRVDAENALRQLGYIK